MNALMSPEPMNFVSGNVAKNWSRWEQQFLTYFVACELGKKVKETQVAILLHTAGTEAQEIHRTLTYAEEKDSKDYNTVLSKLRAYCEPHKNIVFERHQFWIRDQLENETIGQWVTGLRTRAAKCIEVHTDHRPLESILKKPIANASLRLQRTMLQLQRYTLEVKYIPGKYMYVADTLSRAFIKGESSARRKM